jgi:hypothetical protein
MPYSVGSLIIGNIAITTTRIGNGRSTVGSDSYLRRVRDRASVNTNGADRVPDTDGVAGITAAIDVPDANASSNGGGGCYPTVTRRGNTGTVGTNGLATILVVTIPIITIPVVTIPIPVVVISTIIDIRTERPRRCSLIRSRCGPIRELVGKGHCRAKGDETSDKSSPANNASLISLNELALRHSQSFPSPPLTWAAIPEPLPLLAIIDHARLIWNRR